MTEAVPFGIYTAPAHIIRTEIRHRVSDGEKCYIQLLQRMSAQTYSVRVAYSYADLKIIHDDQSFEAVERRVFVSTIKRQDLHTQCHLITRPDAEQPIFAAPDCVLKDKRSSFEEDDLQLVASSAWLCYFRVIGVLVDGDVRVRVAALPHRVDSGRFYLTTLSRDEFALAFPLERNDTKIATCDLREKVEARANALLQQPVEHFHHQVIMDDEEQNTTPSRPAYPREVVKMLHPVVLPERAWEIADDAPLATAKAPQTDKLRPIYIPATIAQKAKDRFVEVMKGAPATRKQEQKMWLQAALCSLRSCREQTTKKRIQEAIDKQDQCIRAVLVNWLSSSILLVEAVPVPKKGKKGRVEGYIVRVEQPKMAAS